MEIFRSLKTFLLNHRRKFIISGIAVGSAVALFHYVGQQEKRRQKNQITDFLENMRRQRYFDSIQITSDRTIISLGKDLENRVICILNIDHIVADLRKNPQDMLMWENLKISTFTQICLMVYAHTILVFVLKIQFAIIGGFVYKSSSENNGQINQSAQKTFISLCVDFMKNGLFDLCDFIKNKVTNIVSGLDLKKELSVRNLQDIFWSIQTSINTDEFVERLPAYLHIKSCMKKTNDSTLLQIYEDTADILSTKELTSNCVYSLSSWGFTCVAEQLLSLMSMDGETNEKTLPTAKIIPVLHNLVKLKANEDGDIWLNYLLSSEKLKILCANVYESYC